MPLRPQGSVSDGGQMKWHLLDTGIGTAEENMRKDAELLEDLSEKGPGILHFYDWQEESATYGYFTDPSDFLELSAIESVGLKLARRPTGGGIIFHQWDWAFSLLVPSESCYFSRNTLENYAFVNTIVSKAVEEFLGGGLKPILTPVDEKPQDKACGKFCMATPTKYDVVWEGKKIAGAAQRKCKQGFLHQGSVSLILPQEEILDKILKKNSNVKEAMRAHTFPLLGKETSKSVMMQARLKLKQLFTKHLLHA